MNPVVVAAIITGGAAVVSAIVVGVFSLVKRDKKKKNSGVRISKNKQTDIFRTKISGDVEIESNKDLKIRGGEIDGKT